MRQRAWTVGEEKALAVLADLGDEQIAAALGRSRKSVRNKASRLGVSVKRRSKLTGTELGQVALDRIKRNDPGLLCPVCGKRLIGVARTGLCGVCHKLALTEAHKAKVAEAEAQRELWKWQQKSSRAKRGLPDQQEPPSRSAQPGKARPGR